MVAIGRRHFIRTFSGILSSLPLLGFTRYSSQQADPFRIIIRSCWDSEKTGDFAALPAAYKMVLKNIPLPDVTLWSATMNDQLKEILNQNFTRVNILEGNIGPDGKPDSEDLSLALDEADLLIYLPDSQPEIDWSMNGNGTETASLRYCLEKEVPFVVYGLGFRPLSNSQLGPMQEILDGAALSFCTHSPIMDQLKDNKIKIKSLEEGIDPLFGYDLRQESLARNYLSEKGIGLRDFIALTYSSPEDDPETRDGALEKLMKLIDQWIEDHDHDFLMIPENEKDLNDLQILHERLSPKASLRAHVYDGLHLPSQLTSILTKSRIVVSLSPVMSYLTVQTNIPLLHLELPGNAPASQVIRDIGLEDYIVQLNTVPVEELNEQLEDIHKNYLKVLLNVQKAGDASEKTLAKSFGEIAKYLQKNRPKESKKEKKKKK